ncbi:MAG: alpha-amylase family glycosyl hydrolase, partial [Myxococcota bacterium]|nr:alpha-amylase family glycosyl hydrolase [Myxococcota bacterium]
MIWLLLGLQSVAKPLDAHFLYFILVDRFYNGQTANDTAIDLKDPQAFHGGDLQGIEQKIPYLEKMGVDALWLSPIFHMRKDKFEGHGAFHGYWIQDLDKVEPVFGGEQALNSLSAELKTKDISLIMDMVYNHVSFDSPMVQEKPDWFHEVKPIVDWNDPYELTHHQVHGLPDLDQSKEPVYDYLKSRSLYWKEQANLGGFRIDAIRHMENEFLSRLSLDLKEENWLLGEDFQGNPASLIERAQETKLDALFDFPLYYAVTDLFCRD